MHISIPVFTAFVQEPSLLTPCKKKKRIAKYACLPIWPPTTSCEEEETKWLGHDAFSKEVQEVNQVKAQYAPATNERNVLMTVLCDIAVRFVSI